MKVGTKSVLFGAHCFLIHPLFVLAAWWKLYGFPWDPRLWVAFFVHDLGYWGKPNMDGPEGETHVELGAKVMGFLFDMYKGTISFYLWKLDLKVHIFRVKHGLIRQIKVKSRIPDFSAKWSNFSKYHSRFYAKRDGINPSRLCVADKLAIALEPTWFYLPRANWSGEICEYMALAKQREEQGEKLNKYEAYKLASDNQKDWFNGVKAYMIRWVEAHRHDQNDTWTPPAKQAVNNSGVWQ